MTPETIQTEINKAADTLEADGKVPLSKTHFADMKGKHIMKIKVSEATPLNVEQMTFSAMQRFVAAVDQVLQANDLCAEERRDLIGFWAYQYARHDMQKQLKAAIARCQASEFVHPTASSVVDWISGDVVPFGGGTQ